MRLKRVISKYFIAAIICLSAKGVSAQESSWARRLTPSSATVQYAGNIGMFAAGPSWSYGKNHRWETDALIGFFPKENSVSGAMTFTLRENLVPWRLVFSENPTIPKRFSPATFSPTVFFMETNIVSGGQYWFHEPQKYNNGDYYRFSSRMRVALGLGSRIGIGRSEIYYGVSTYDLALRYAFCNKNINLFDILALGLGIRYRFF